MRFTIQIAWQQNLRDDMNDDRVIRARSACQSVFALWLHFLKGGSPASHHFTEVCHDLHIWQVISGPMLV